MALVVEDVLQTTAAVEQLHAVGSNESRSDDAAGPADVDMAPAPPATDGPSASSSSTAPAQEEATQEQEDQQGAAGPGPDRYPVIKNLGRGAFGQVDLISNGKKSYALKQYHFEDLQNSKHRDLALEEGKILQRLQHPNIVRCYWVQVTSYTIYLLLQYIEGGDLHHYIAERREKRGNRIPERRITSWFRQLLEALVHIHSLSILHRDIKPSNILLSGDERRVFLADFGVCRMLKSTRGLAQTNVGSPVYAAPEVWSGKSYTSKIDIFSLGCCMFEICAFKPPFDGRNLVEICRQIYRGPPKVRGTYPALGCLISSMLSANPAHRPSAKHLLEKIAEQCGGLESLNTSQSTPRSCAAVGSSWAGGGFPTPRRGAGAGGPGGGIGGAGAPRTPPRRMLANGTSGAGPTSGALGDHPQPRGRSGLVGGDYGNAPARSTSRARSQSREQFCTPRRASLPIPLNQIRSPSAGPPIDGNQVEGNLPRRRTRPQQAGRKFTFSSTNRSIDSQRWELASVARGSEDNDLSLLDQDASMLTDGAGAAFETPQRPPGGALSRLGSYPGAGAAGGQQGSAQLGSAQLVKSASICEDKPLSGSGLAGSGIIGAGVGGGSSSSSSSAAIVAGGSATGAGGNGVGALAPVPQQQLLQPLAGAANNP